MKYLILLSLFTSIVSCSSALYHSRTKFDLKKINGIIISNTVTNPYKVLGSKGAVKLEYSLIIKNTNKEVVKIDLSHSKININEIENELNCKSLKNEAMFELAKDAYARINCTQIINADDKNMLMRKDTLTKLNISLGNGVITQHIFKLKRQDFR